MAVSMGASAAPPGRHARSDLGTGRLLAASLAFLLAVGCVRAAEVPPGAPLPPERPAELAPNPSPPSPPTAEPITGPPLPPERPEILKTAPTAGPAGEPPEPTPPALAASPMSPPTPPPRPADLAPAPKLPPDDTACRRRLGRLGAQFEVLPAIENGGCGASAPLKLTVAAEGVPLGAPATLTCVAAEALARWAGEVQVVAEAELGEPLKTLSVGTSYECRGQNHDPDAKLSEHAYANGVDVMGFTFAKRPALLVGPATPGTPEARFLDTVRARACGFFRTVLGPGSDAAHANHLHLDERERPSGHRLCQ